MDAAAAREREGLAFEKSLENSFKFMRVSASAFAKTKKTKAFSPSLVGPFSYVRFRFGIKFQHSFELISLKPSALLALTAPHSRRFKL